MSFNPTSTPSALNPVTSHDLLPPLFNLPNALKEKLELEVLIQQYDADIKQKNLEPFARALIQKIEAKVGQAYTIDPQTLPPYSITQLCQILYLDPLDLLKEGKNINRFLYVHIKEENQLEILLFEKDTSKDLFFCCLQERFLLTEELKAAYSEQWENLDPQQEKQKYALLYSTQRTIYYLTMQEKAVQGESKPALFYCYKAKDVAEDLRNAPFHHEAQPTASSSLCGMHALNAYIGCRQLDAKSIGELLITYNIEMFGMEKDQAISMVHPVQEDRVDYTNLTGIDTESLRYVLQALTRRRDIPSLWSDTSCLIYSGVNNPLTTYESIDHGEVNLLLKLKMCDRFILGLSGTEAHFLTWRQDETGQWWKIDSKLKYQEAFENDQAVIDHIKKEYPGNYLLSFIFPPSPERTADSEMAAQQLLNLMTSKV